MRYSDWKQATPFLWYCVLVFACGDLIFGLDSSSFGSLQALPSFLKDFGEQRADGSYWLETNRKSLMNSIVYVGRIGGVLVFEPFTDKFGYRAAFLLICIAQVIAVIVELTAKEWIQFTIGRIIAYFAVGMIEGVVPSYSAEVSPPALRGFFAGLITPINTAGSVWGAAMSRAFATETSSKGWLIPIAIQMIPAIIALPLMWWVVESPRWLVAKGKTDLALINLRKLRRPEDVAAGLPEAEIAALEQAIELDLSVREGGWLDLLRGSMWRRTLYACLAFFFYQVTGNQFYNAYGPSFFISVGLGANSFTYAIIVQLVGMIGSWMFVLLTDRVGRRPLAITGASLLIIWNFLIGTIGSRPNPSESDKQTVVASFVLLIWSTKISWATLCFLFASELGGVRMRKKIMMAGIFNDVLWSFVVSFTSPYIMNYIGGKIGFIFGGVAIVSLIFAILFLPELAGRSLEEVDELFEKPRFRWGWQFKNAQTEGVGHRIAALESGNEGQLERIDSGKGQISHMEQAQQTPLDKRM